MKAETNRAYWRSLERLADSPALASEPAGEFSEGAALAPDAVSRRAMLKLLGASFALAGLASCRRPEQAIVALSKAPEDLVPGLSKTYATTMPFGTSAYGLLVECHEGRPTKIEGNELHPSSRGRAVAWIQAAILSFYDPDRSSKVLRGGEASSWKQFFEHWASWTQRFEASEGGGLAVLCRSYSSPTIARLVARFRERFPQARWATYEPVSDENIYEGLRLATGTAARPVYHFEEAKTLVALDSDFLLTEAEALVHAHGFAAGRRVSDAADSMNRLYVVESTLSLTGANADHRLVLRASRIPALLAALAAELQRQGLALGLPLGSLPPAPPEIDAHRLRLIARDLMQSRGASLLLVGRAQPPEAHALALVINVALGAMGRTLTLHELRDVGWAPSSEIQSLSEQMKAGHISTLVVLGGNPVYNAPSDLGFADAMDRVEHTVHLSTHVDETSRRSEWHLPEAHFLEAWGDTRDANGVPSVIQPMVAPLYQGRSAIELLGSLIQDGETPGYGLVRDTWLEEILGSTDVEPRWTRILHDGVSTEAIPPPVAVTLREGAAKQATRDCSRAVEGDDGLEVVFTVSPAVYDGRFANNGWLQELPHPITKCTWDNPARVSPRTARELGLETGSVVRLELEGRHIEAVVLVSPGQVDAVACLELGYGRTAAGRVGDGVGTNAFALRRSHALWVNRGLRVRATGNLRPLAQTQEHGEMEGRDIVREATADHYRKEPKLASAEETPPETLPLWREHDYSEGHQWGMLIDLSTCIGCNACVVACQSENNIPIVGKEQVRRGRQMHWLRVDRYFAGPADVPEVVFQPVACVHCENAPCEQVCPVGATVHDSEGLNTMIYNRCIGTRYCSNNCPYKVRRFNFFNYTKELPETLHMAMNPDVTVRSRGVMEKCTFCIQRVNEAKIRAKREGRTLRDGELQTACQQTCPAEAIVFGDINDPDSRVRKAKAQGRNYVLLGELATKPRTSYLAKLRNPNPDWEESR